MFWKIILAPGRRREIVYWVHDRFGVSQRRGCSALRFDRCVHRYRTVRPDQAPLRQRIKEISHGPDEWHEYLARFTRGALDAIILLPEGWNVSSNVSGAEVRSVSPEIQLTSLYADRMIGRVRGRATIGGELDDVIAALPADRRKAVEERSWP